MRECHAVVHFAAESHVGPEHLRAPRGHRDQRDGVQFTLLQVARSCVIPSGSVRHISTDEVYGDSGVGALLR